MNKLRITLLMVTICSICQWSAAQNSEMSRYYNKSAGSNAPQIEELDEKGDVKKDNQGKIVYKEVKKDSYGNAQGNQYDLAVDGAFEGQTILVLQLYSEPSFDFKSPEKALKEKGFGVYRYIGNPPTADQLKKDLQ